MAGGGEGVGVMERCTHCGSMPVHEVHARAARWAEIVAACGQGEAERMFGASLADYVTGIRKGTPSHDP